MSISEDLKYIGCQVDELEMQNARLQGLVDSLTEQLENRSVDEKVARLLDLLEPDIASAEERMGLVKKAISVSGRDRVLAIVDLYKEIRGLP